MVLGHFNGLMVINTKEIGKRQNKWTKMVKALLVYGKMTSRYDLRSRN